ncbi:MAG: MATE family efflux transporter [Bryobacteraceae bacterium]
MKAEPTTASPPDRSLWRGIRESIVGTQHDFTTGAIERAILLLAIPMVLEMSMESLFGIVDVFFVARLGKDAVAAVGITESLLTMVFAIAMGLSMATTAMVARRIGEKDPQGAAVAAVQAIVIGLAVSAVVGVTGYFAAAELLRLMGASEALIAGNSAYTSVILGGSVTVVLLFLINAIFRGAGDAAIAMRALWIANIVNIVLDPCLIFGLGPFPEMGVAGAGVATTIGRGTGVFYQLSVLFSGRGRVVIHRSDWRIELPVMIRLLRIAITGMFQFLVATASWLGLVRLIALFGSSALAGYTIALRLIIFALLPSWGMSNAAATLVGQNLGAGEPGRAELSVWKTGFYNMIFLGAVAVVFIVFAWPLIGLFTEDQAVRSVGVDCLRFVSCGYVFYAWGMVMVQAFNGAGDTRTPTLINLGCYWLWQIPLACVLGLKTSLGTSGIFLAIAISESTLAVAGILAFRAGKWKKQKV